MGFPDISSAAVLVSANASDKQNLPALVRKKCRKAERDQSYQTSQLGPFSADQQGDTEVRAWVPGHSVFSASNI